VSRGDLDTSPARPWRRRRRVSSCTSSGSSARDHGRARRLSALLRRPADNNDPWKVDAALALYGARLCSGSLVRWASRRISRCATVWAGHRPRRRARASTIWQEGPRISPATCADIDADVPWMRELLLLGDSGLASAAPCARHLSPAPTRRLRRHPPGAAASAAVIVEIGIVASAHHGRSRLREPSSRMHHRHSCITCTPGNRLPVAQAARGSQRGRRIHNGRSGPPATRDMHATHMIRLAAAHRH